MQLEVLPRKFDEKIKELNDANARLVAQDEGYRDIQVLAFTFAKKRLH